MRLFWGLIFVFLVPLLTWGEFFKVGHPVMAGGGCPNGTARAAVLEDGSTISILFDNFLTSASKGYFPPEKTARKCQFRIPITIPQGYSILPLHITYTGFAKVTGKNIAAISTSGPLLTIGQKTTTRPPIVNQIKNISDNFQIQQVINVNKLFACAKQDSIQFSTEISLVGNGLPFKGPGFFLDEAMVAIDSADIGGAQDPIQIKLELAKCK